MSPGVEYELIKAERDVRYFERRKDEKERNEQLEDERECPTVDRLQILCDVAARTAANGIPTLPAVSVQENMNVTVTHVYSDQGKEKAQRD